MGTREKSSLLAALLLMAGIAIAQVSVRIGGANVEVGVGSSSVAVNESGAIASDVQMEGVAVINGQVYIDGVKIPQGTKTYKSAKTGKVYRIKRDGDGNVTVEEK